MQVGMKTRQSTKKSSKQEDLMKRPMRGRVFRKRGIGPTNLNSGEGDTGRVRELSFSD